jgi:pilus assembly protein Flp/PilA
MTALYTRLANRLRDDEGATAVEYGLLIALIATIIIGTVGALGGQIDAAFGALLGTF